MSGLSFGERVLVVLSFVWRAYAVAALATVVGALIGALAGAALGALGAPPNVIRAVAGSLGLLVGVVSWWFYVGWLFASRHSRWQLQLVEVD